MNFVYRYGMYYFMERLWRRNIPFMVAILNSPFCISVRFFSLIFTLAFAIQKLNKQTVIIHIILYICYVCRIKVLLLVLMQDYIIFIHRKRIRPQSPIVLFFLFFIL